MIKALLVYSALFLTLHYAQHLPQMYYEDKASAPIIIRIKAHVYEFEPKSISVPKGHPIKLIVTSEDIAHGFAIEKLNIDERIEAKQTKVIEFTPDRAGRFRFYCSVFCGDGHAEMIGNLLVTEN